MPNPMDSVQFNSVPNSAAPQNLEQLIAHIRQNPSAFEEQVRRNNPQAYQMALQIRNSPNSQAIAMQMLQAKGLGPNILSMLGIK